MSTLQRERQAYRVPLPLVLRHGHKAVEGEPLAAESDAGEPARMARHAQ